MTISEIADLSTALSSLAVVASLIYLALQVHQNSKHTRALIHQGRAARTTQAAIGMADTDVATAMIVANGITPTAELVKFVQFTFVSNGIIAHWEDVFDQHEDGLLSDDQFGSWKGTVIMALRGQAFRGIWNQWKADRPNTNVKFKAFIDGIAATVTPGTLSMPAAIEEASYPNMPPWRSGAANVT